MKPTQAIKRVKQIQKRAANNAKRPRTKKEYREEYRLDEEAIGVVLEKVRGEK